MVNSGDEQWKRLFSNRGLPSMMMMMMITLPGDRWNGTSDRGRNVEDKRVWREKLKMLRILYGEKNNSYRWSEIAASSGY